MEKKEEGSNCPYKSFMGKFSFFGSKNKEKKVEETINTTMDTEKGIELNSKINIDSNQSKCPFGYGEKVNKENPHKQEESKESSKKEDKSKEDLSDEEETNTGGCPVMNKTRKDPPNKHFEAYYEIPRFGPFDFMFFMRGMLEKKEWIEKTEKIRSFPRHMKYTLFLQHQEKLQKVHEKEFPMVFFVYDDIKEKGNRFYRRKKYREAIEHYTYAYGLLKWIEFKDKKRQEEFLKKPSLDAILDEDILEKHVYLDDVKVEEDSYKACVVYLLMNMTYAYMELRHYSEAIDCLDECMPIAEDKVPDLYFRRSQARTYNKFSSADDYEKAKSDIEYAIKLKDDPMYKEHLEVLKKIIEEKSRKQLERTEKVFNKAKRNFQHIKGKNISEDDIIYTSNKDAITQKKIMKE